MVQKRHSKNIILVAVALISASCLGQQVQEANRFPAPAPPLGIAPQNATFPAAAPVATASTPASPAATGSPSAPLLPETSPPAAAPPTATGQQFEAPAQTSGPLPPGGPSSQLAFDADESVPISPNPAFAILAPNRQPARGGVPQPFSGQRNDVAIFALGNFNPVTDISIRNLPHLAVSSNKSSLGGSAEYRHWFSNRTALGLLYAQNPSDGKLLWQGQNYIWPQMRRDMSVLATRSFNLRDMAPFVSAGPGMVATNGYGNCGWSAGFAFVAGLGTDVHLSRRFSARTGITFLDTRSGCYDDHTCHETWGVVKDLRVGLAYKWSGEKVSDSIR
jgi:hypothetical protein